MENGIKKNITDYYSKTWKYWSDVYEKENTDELNRLFQVSMRKDIILKYIDNYASGKKLSLIDIGCGAGILMNELIRKGHYVTGIDLTKEMVVASKENNYTEFINSFECVQGDIEWLPFADETFDIVVGAGVMSHLPNIEIGISECSRILKNNGIFVLTLPNIFRIYNLIDPFYLITKGFKYIKYKLSFQKTSAIFVNKFGEESIPIQKYSYRQLKQLFNGNNFTITEIKSLGFGPLTFWKKDLFSDKRSLKISNIFENLCRYKIFSFLNKFSNFWVIEIRKN